MIESLGFIFFDMTKVRDITGQRFGKLVAVEPAFRKNGAAYWLCACDCGNKKVIRLGDLSQGRTKSCGCWKSFVSRTRAVTHGMTNTRLYNIWTGMKSRCENKNDKFYHRYGGRGIKVCESWKSFDKFMEWAIPNGYDEVLKIDRINNDGDYEPENCKWSTQIEQSNNMCRNHLITFNGETMSLMEWHRKTGINYSTIRSRAQRGCSPAEIFA